MSEIAVCKFCGQLVAGCDVPDNATKNEAIEIGTLHCSCPHALDYQHKRLCADKAKEKLDEILVTVDKNHNIQGVDKSIIDHLKTGIDLLAEDKAKSIAVDLGSVGTIKLSVGPGKVTVHRSITLKEEM